MVQFFRIGFHFSFHLESIKRMGGFQVCRPHERLPGDARAVDDLFQPRPLPRRPEAPIRPVRVVLPNEAQREAERKPMKIIDARLERGSCDRSICCDGCGNWYKGNVVGTFCHRGAGVMPPSAFRRADWERWGMGRFLVLHRMLRGVLGVRRTGSYGNTLDLLDGSPRWTSS